MSQPFILTAALPDDIQNWADGLRRSHFPPERNHLHAHVTMFHAFAPSLLDELTEFIPSITRNFAPLAAEITGLMNLGKGTAIRIHSEPLLAVRELIAEHFHGSLTAQDLHNPRPHITIQNKVTKEQARALQAELAPIIGSRRFEFAGLELYRYLGGPWELIKRCPFRGKERL